MTAQAALVIIGLIGLMLAFATLVLKIIEVARSKWPLGGVRCWSAGPQTVSAWKVWTRPLERPGSRKELEWLPDCIRVIKGSYLI